VRPACASVPPSTFTRTYLPGGKCAGSVHVQVRVAPVVAGASVENIFCARQYAPMAATLSIQTSPSAFAWLTLATNSAIATGL